MELTMNFANVKRAAAPAASSEKRLLENARKANADLQRKLIAANRAVEIAKKKSDESLELLSIAEDDLKNAKKTIVSLEAKVSELMASVAELQAKRNKKDKKQEQAASSEPTDGSTQN